MAVARQKLRLASTDRAAVLRAAAHSRSRARARLRRLRCCPSCRRVVGCRHGRLEHRRQLLGLPTLTVPRTRQGRFYRGAERAKVGLVELRDELAPFAPAMDL